MIEISGYYDDLFVQQEFTQNVYLKHYSKVVAYYLYQAFVHGFDLSFSIFK